MIETFKLRRVMVHRMCGGDVTVKRDEEGEDAYYCTNCFSYPSAVGIRAVTRRHPAPPLDIHPLVIEEEP